MRSRWDTARTEAFSDGVFAIAITLLVLDIRVPARDFGDLWHGIAHEWPAYLAYVTSFLTIGGIWLGHHGLFGRLRYVDGVVMRINLLLLMAASFLPFPTRLIAEAIRVTDAERAAVIFYGASLLAISLLVAAMWRAVAARPELLRPEIGRPEVDALLRATAPASTSWSCSWPSSRRTSRRSATCSSPCCSCCAPAATRGPPPARRSAVAAENP